MKDLLFEQERTQALAVTCVYCGRGPGEACVNPLTRIPLDKQPAHPARVKAGALLVLAGSARQAQERRCECCDLPAYSCGKAKEAAERRQTAEGRAELQARGYFPASYPGRCGICWTPFEPGTLIRSIDKWNWRAECCADGAS